MAMAVQRPSSVSRRKALNRRYTILLLGAASVIWLPFGAGLNYAVVRAVVFLAHPAVPAVTLLWLGAGLSAVTLAVPWLLYLRLASSPLRTLELCGPLSLRTPTQDARVFLESLAADAGLPVPRLCVLDSLLPNALAAGVKPSQGMIVLTRGLLQ